MDVVGYMDAKNLGNDLEFGPFVQLCPPSSAAANSPNVAVGGNASAVPAWLTTIALSRSCLGLSRPF